MSDSEAHVAEWQAAGLIDATTADRIRAFEAAAATTGMAGRAASPFNAMFGPSLTIGEVFSYLGALFVLAATDAFLVRLAAPAPSSDWALAIGTAIQAVVLLAIGLRLRSGDRRRSRSAGLLFLVATVHGGVSGSLAASAIGLEGLVSGVVGSLVALVVGVATRITHPGLLTQAAVLGAVTAVATASLAWLRQSFFPEPYFLDSDLVVPTRLDPLVAVLGEATWWLVTALTLGLIGLREATRSHADDDGASRRAGVSRFWAGMVAVIGFAGALSRSAPLASGEYDRVVEPWVADLAILAVALILVQRAFRRDDSAFVYPAALALIIALTDFNVSYLGGATEIGLLVEGLILLAVGFGAQRIRRMIGGRGASPTAGSVDDGGVPAAGQELRPEA
jgi:hypothetical protein